MRLLPNAALVGLGLRRGLPLPLALAAAALAVLLARAGWGESPGLAVAGGGPERAAALVRGLTRLGVFGALAGLFVPFLVLRAAAWARAWRGPEADWLAPRATGRAAVVLSAFAGLWLAAAAWVAGAGWIADRAAGAGRAGESAYRALPVPPVPSALLEAEGAAVRWSLAAEVPAGAIAGLRVATAPGSGVAADVVLRAARGERESSVRRRVAGPVRIELEVVAGAGPLELVLEHRGGDGPVVLDGSSARLLVPCASERLALVELGARTWLALGAWLALALGLGTWLSAATSALGIAALWCAGWLRFGLPEWVPGHDLGEAARVVGEGHVPAPQDAAVWIGLAVAAGVGLGLATASLRGWRRAA